MKLGPITKLYTTTSKTFNDDVMSENCDVIIIFFNLWSIRSNPEAGFRMQSLKTGNRTKKSLTELSQYCFEQRYYFCQKTAIFCKKC